MADVPQEGKRQARKGVVYLARFGYAARGVVYVLVGVLAVLGAWGQGQTEGTRGALAKLLSQPFGQVLLGIVGFGLAGYAVWRFCQAIFDTEGHGKEAKGLAIRAGFIVSALSHLALTVFSISLILGAGGSGRQSGGSSGGGSKSDWTARLMEVPFGRWLVGILGLIVVGVGIAQIGKAITGGFKKQLMVGPQKMKWASPVSRTGLTARGITFAIIGGFFAYAAYTFDPSKARGLQGALTTLRDQPFGKWLLTAVGIGLLAFAIYCFILALWRRINPPGRTSLA